MAKTMGYLQGFANHFQSAVEDGLLPQGQNAPQHVAKGLYTEQLSGSAFTMARAENLRTWLYRIRPAIQNSEFTSCTDYGLTLSQPLCAAMPPTQLRWDPLPRVNKATDFIDGLYLMASNADPINHWGTNIYHYACDQSMRDRYFYSADGEFIILPQAGSLQLRTEFGLLSIGAGDFAVIPRGIRFQIQLLDDHAYGYAAENNGAPLRLPELGPLGANGLANPRDFYYPVAHAEEKMGDFHLICKFQGGLWQADIDHSPFDVMAWHGNYLPYKYHLKDFNVINSVSYDHPDPSIFTVMTSPSQRPGRANLDFVIFPERWLVAEHTFRPPYFHRNVMSEYMGLIYGEYDAKAEHFRPGGSSLHNCMSAHGPDQQSYQKAIERELKPVKVRNTLAFMFESAYVWRASEAALSAGFLQGDYLGHWGGFGEEKASR